MSTLVTSKRILIVEDEPDILEAYKDILVPQAKSATTSLKSSRAKPTEGKVGSGRTDTDQFELTLVNNGEDAVKAIETAKKEGRPFALGFFDVLLGEGIDGIETVRRIHEIDQDLYTVLVTAYQDRHVDAIQSIFGSAFQDRWDYLNKPFSEGEILQKARNMVSMWNIRKRETFQQERLDELKGRLAESEKSLTIAAVARSVGHEFGNILLQIMGRADLSRTGKETEMKQALETILVATEHASKVLERFKSLAKPHEMHQHSKIKITDPIDETLLLLSHELKRRSINTVVEVGTLPPVNASRTMLVQVFMNLVINAMHAMDQNGKVEFRGRVVDDAVEITVRDTGPGVPENHYESVFHPFFTTKGEKGTGLGLAICKEIIEISHSGSLTVGKHPEGGAVFTIRLPVADGGGEE